MWVWVITDLIVRHKAGDVQREASGGLSELSGQVPEAVGGLVG